MKKFALFVFSISFNFLFSQDQSLLRVKEFTLDNGLKVFLNEDSSTTNIFGAVAINAGSKHDPRDATGIAHYLEHLIFKGTSELGTWNYEKEKVHLDSIRFYYDQLTNTHSKKERLAIQLKINKQSVAASKYGLPNEMFKLLKSIGGANVNAFTDEEITVYYSSFPAHQIIKWLDLYSQIFQNPAFRSFQSELEVVYEEKNRATDDFQYLIFEEFIRNFYKNHPYGQQTTLGSIEHLKNPPLNKMHEFFNTYYVANNMALILCGNFDSETIMPVIKEKFGRLKQGSIPEYPNYEEKAFEKRAYIKKRLSPIRVGLLGYRTVLYGHPDKEALDVCNYLLYNESETGLLNNLVLNNQLMYAGAYDLTYKDHAGNLIFFIPKIIGQSLKKAEKLVLFEIEKLKEGNFSETLLDASKNDIYKDFQLALENYEERSFYIAYANNLGISWKDYMTYPEKIQRTNKQDIVRIAKKYYGDDYLAMYSKMGFPRKPKLKKPPYDPVVTSQEKKSAYADYFEELPELDANPKFIDFQKDVDQFELEGGHRLYCSVNPINDIYTLTIKFKAGNYTFHDLPYASALMNYSGTKNHPLSELKEKFQQLGCSYHFSSNDSYFTISLKGLENTFEDALKLLNELLKLPTPDENNLKTVVNNEITQRKVDARSSSFWSRALINYAIFKNESSYLRRFSKSELKSLVVNDLVNTIKKVTEFPASVYYVGKQNATIVKKVFTDQLPLSKQPQISSSPIYLEGKE